MMRGMWTAPFGVRYALRSLIRNKRTSIVSVSLFAGAIGVSAAVYAVVEAVVLHPIVMRSSERVAVIWQRDDVRGTPVVEAAFGEADTWRRNARSLDDLAVFSSVNWSLSLVDRDSRTRLAYAAVSAPFFDVVGIAPAMGRALNSQDEGDSEPRVIVMSDQLWRQRFGADPGIIGTYIRVQEDIESPVRPVEVVGIMPPEFDFPRGTQLWVPAAPSVRAFAQQAGQEAGNFLQNLRVFYGLGRLRQGATFSQVAQDISSINRAQAETGSVDSVSAAVVTPLDAYLQGRARPVLLTMFGGALLMVLLACSSVAGLQVFRAATEENALAVHMALGAERRDLVIRTFIEGLLLALAGLLGALIIGSVIVQWLVSSAPLDVPRLSTAKMASWRVASFMIAVTALVGLVGGLWPALFIGRIESGRTLTSGARAVMHPRERRIQRVVVGSQVAFAIMLLTGAALFIRSVQSLDRTDVGFDAHGLVSIDVEPSWKEPERWDSFYEQLLSRTRQLSGVVDTSGIYLRPLSGAIGNDTIPVLAGQQGLGDKAPWRNNPRANIESITPGYFRTMGIPLLRGRDFAPRDIAAGPNVVIVSGSAAARYWPGRDPIGQQLVVATQRIRGSIEEPRWQTVVGVAGDVRYRGLLDPRLDIYLPAAQSTMRVKQLLVRTSGPAGLVVPRIRAIAHELDPAAYVDDVVLMQDALARESAPWRFAMWVLTLFGALGAVLATVGLIGIVWLVVATRGRELALRAALGATPNHLRNYVLTDAMLTTTAATVVGVFGALAIGRSLTGLVVGISPHDSVSLAGAVVVTLCAGGIGTLLAAQGAARTSPGDVLRS
jgi:putative ABC transport system permease protein